MTRKGLGTFYFSLIYKLPNTRQWSQELPLLSAPSKSACSLALQSCMDNRSLKSYYIIPAGHSDHISGSFPGRKLVSVGRLHVSKVSGLDSRIMYVLSACPTQLFLGQLLSGLHLLTMDYLTDGSYIFRMFKNSILRVPDTINNLFPLIQRSYNASRSCSKASEDRGRREVQLHLPGGPRPAGCWCGFWGFCNPRVWLGSSEHFCPETGPLLWMEMSPHNLSSSFEGCPPLDLQGDKTAKHRLVGYLLSGLWAQQHRSEQEMRCSCSQAHSRGPDEFGDLSS